MTLPTDRTALFGVVFVCRRDALSFLKLSGIVVRDLRMSMGESQFFENVYFLSARDQGRRGFDSAAVAAAGAKVIDSTGPR